MIDYLLNTGIGAIALIAVGSILIAVIADALFGRHIDEQERQARERGRWN